MSGFRATLTSTSSSPDEVHLVAWRRWFVRLLCETTISYDLLRIVSRETLTIRTCNRYGRRVA
jgi:hypothetical protein